MNEIDGEYTLLITATSYGAKNYVLGYQVRVFALDSRKAEFIFEKIEVAAMEAAKEYDLAHPNLPLDTA